MKCLQAEQAECCNTRWTCAARVVLHCSDSVRVAARARASALACAGRRHDGLSESDPGQKHCGRRGSACGRPTGAAGGYGLTHVCLLPHQQRRLEQSGRAAADQLHHVLRAAYPVQQYSELSEQVRRVPSPRRHTRGPTKCRSHELPGTAASTAAALLLPAVLATTTFALCIFEQHGCAGAAVAALQLAAARTTNIPIVCEQRFCV